MPMGKRIMQGSQTQWLASRKYPEASSFLGDNLCVSALPRGPKEEEANKGNLSDSLTSLFSNNAHNNLQQGQAIAPTAQMSATAFLQKAAQMGSTISSQAFNNKNFGGLTSPPSPTMSSSNTYDYSKNTEVYNLFKQASSTQSENINELVRSLSSTQAPIMKDELHKPDIELSQEFFFFE